MKISIVVAVSENNAIGAKGNLLWRLPKDMQYFKELTYGRHVLMGRKTFESIPEKFRPLPGRVNIVITRNTGLKYEGCKMVSSFQEGVEFARDNGERELMVIGGGEIYREALAVTDKVYLTKVHHTFEQADTFFDVLDNHNWQCTQLEDFPADEKHLYPFSFIVLERKG